MATVSSASKIYKGFMHKHASHQIKHVIGRIKPYGGWNISHPEIHSSVLLGLPCWAMTVPLLFQIQETFSFSKIFSKPYLYKVTHYIAESKWMMNNPGWSEKSKLVSFVGIRLICGNVNLWKWILFTQLSYLRGNPISWCNQWSMWKISMEWKNRLFHSIRKIVYFAF